MSSEPLTINLGQNEAGRDRRLAYERQAAMDGCRSLNEWIKRVCDRASGFKERKGEIK